MEFFTTNLLGGFGNTLFQYAFARAYAESQGAVLAMPPWVGSEIFQLSDPLAPPGTQLVPSGYHQDQSSLIYTRAQARSWFQWRPHILEALKEIIPSYPLVIAHRRVGDYFGYGYVVVSEQSYQFACGVYNLPGPPVFVTEESPLNGGKFFSRFPWLPDFYRLTQSPILLRGNSTFSWWAAVLSDCDVYSPLIGSLSGGREQDCPFVKGNHPKFANLHFLTDLHLKES